MRSPYLTKSRFKLGLECLTKLYYTGKKKEYADQNLDDPFLKALAEGGFQVGELSKYMFCDDPVAEQITVDTLNYEEALQRTEEMLARPGRVVIAEAAFRYNNLFIRADIVVKEGNSLRLYEVKAKSIDGEDESNLDEEATDNPYKFLSINKKARTEKVSSKWVSYLYDLAFQKYVVTKAMTGWEVEANLLLVNKNAVATVDGLNQKFKISRDGKTTAVVPQQGITAADLGAPILEAVPMDTIVEKIRHQYPVPTDYDTGLSFEEFVALCERVYTNNEQVFTPIGKKCKDCQFWTKPGDADQKSGFMECWKKHTGKSEDELSVPLVLDIWGGGSGSRSFSEELILKNKFFLRDIHEEDVMTSGPGADNPGLSKLQRRMEQVNRVKDGIAESYFDKEGFAQEMTQWEWPLHMIDFETSMVALPFHRDKKPYQGIAFQFSHHILHDDGRVEHHNQFLHQAPGVYPNVDFVRALRASLEPHQGSIFRYHNHENTYLRMLHRQLSDAVGLLPETERMDLLNFIDSITKVRPAKNEPYRHGSRAMIDLYEIVLRYYYSPYAGGSNSLKQVLPAIIRDSAFLRSKYGVPGKYGKGAGKLATSLNYDDHVWIQPEKGNDPYKTLQPVFDGFDRELLDGLVKGFDGVADGGAALTAYNYLQFGSVPQDQRQAIADALLRYCELDTLAMVMLVEGWREMMR
jgi:hypothetical protein